MSRPLDELTAAAEAESPTEGRLTRSTARAFAAAVSALLISTLVVSRSGAALDDGGAVAASTATSGTIALVDDDQGQSLFDLRDIGPRTPFERCVDVTYEGTLLPVELTVAAEADGELAAYLNTTIESGTGGSFESCDGFSAEELVFEGTLSVLADAGTIPIGLLYNSGDHRTFRIRFALADTNDALGLSTTSGLVWEVRPK